MTRTILFLSMNSSRACRCFWGEKRRRGWNVCMRGGERLTDGCEVCFRVYDLNGDRYISKEEMFQMLQHCLVRVGVCQSCSRVRWLGGWRRWRWGERFGGFGAQEAGRRSRRTCEWTRLRFCRFQRQITLGSVWSMLAKPQGTGAQFVYLHFRISMNIWWCQLRPWMHLLPVQRHH